MTVAAHQVLDAQAHPRLKAPPEDTRPAANSASTPCGSRPEKPHVFKDVTENRGGPRPRSGPKPRPAKPRRLGWAVVQTHPQAERWAMENLARQGYETYLPLALIQRRDRHTPSILHRVEIPLWSGYGFVLVRSPHWAPINHTAGVLRLLMADTFPHIVPDAVFFAVQAGDALRRMPMPDTLLLRPGAPVTCLYGPFQGREAVVIAAAATTARIAMPMLGALRELVVPIACLTARE